MIFVSPRHLAGADRLIRLIAIADRWFLWLSPFSLFADIGRHIYLPMIDFFRQPPG